MSRRTLRQQRIERWLESELPLGSSVDRVRAVLTRERIEYTPTLNTFPGINSGEVPGGVYELQAATDKSYIGTNFQAGTYIKFIFDRHKRLLKITTRRLGNEL